MKHIFIRKANETGHNQGVWYFLGCLLSFGLGQLIGSIPYIILLFSSGQLAVGGASELLNPENFDIDKNLFLLIILFPFVVSFFLLWAYVRLVHQKPFKLLFTPFRRFNWRYFWGAGLLWFAILLLTEMAGYIQSPENYELRFSWDTFLPLLLISCTVLLIQTSFEELLFRAYGIQWIGKYFRSAWWPLIITSVIFGLVHSFNPEMSHYGSSVMIMYISMGFVLGLITLMSKSLEMALGMHFTNNFFTAVFFNFDESALKTDSVFRVLNMEVGPAQHLFSVVTLLVFVVLLKFIFKLDFNIDKNAHDTEPV